MNPIYRALKNTFAAHHCRHLESRRIDEDLIPRLILLTERIPHIFTSGVIKEVHTWIRDMNSDNIKQFLRENQMELERSFFTPSNRKVNTGKELD